MNYQKLIIIGNATRDAKRQQSKDGGIVFTTFRVGVSDSKNRTVFFPVTVFGKQAEIVAEYVTKGREVLVEGRIEAGNSGRMSVIADRVVFGGGRYTDRPSAGYNRLKQTATMLKAEDSNANAE